MDLATLVEYEKAANSVNTTKAALLEQQDILTQQLRFFTDDRERAKLLGKEDKVKEADEGIQVCISKMEEVNTKLEELDLVPLAQKVWEEAQALQHKLKCDLQQAWQEAHVARDNFLEKLKNIGSLKHESVLVAGDASKVALTLRFNPMSPIGTSGENKFVVDLKSIMELTKG